MSRFICRAVALILITGCGFQPEQLVGLSLDDVKERLGPPTRQDNGTVPASWDGAMGPRPTLLKADDKFIGVLYSDYQGQQVNIFAVSRTTSLHVPEGDCVLTARRWACDDPIGQQH